MTLALATEDAYGIYLAIESEGLPAAGPAPTHLVLSSKLLDLQSAPEVAVLAAGGLEHWCYVAANYVKQSSVTAAAIEVKRLLDLCMGQQNQAFGLVCGYENGASKCFRVNRFQNTPEATNEEVSLSIVQPLGAPDHTSAAQDCATNSIGNGINKLMALVQAIEKRFPGQLIRRPVHVRIMRPGC